MLREGLATARRMGLRFWIFGFAVGVGYNSFLLGDWDRSAAVLSEGLADDPESEDRITVLANAVLVPAYRGAKTDDMIAEIERLVGDSTDLTLVGSMHDARGAAAIAAGRLVEGRNEQRLAADGTTSVNGTMARSMAARAALWDRDPVNAAADLALIEDSGFHVPAVEARRITLRAGLAALEGRDDESLRLYRDAQRRWQALGLVFEEALMYIDAVTLLGPAVPEVRAWGETGREILVRLGATPLVERMDAALAATPPESAVAIPAAEDRAAVQG